jgi:hypothetical protein
LINRHVPVRPFRALLIGVLLATSKTYGADPPTDAQIRARLIAESIRAYPGNCPCPENRDAAGRRCGARSAHSRAGGRTVLCYPEDVTDELVRRYRNAN